MYSDKWLQDKSLHKTTAVEISSTTNIAYWLNEKEQLVGVCVNFELSDDVHYELEANSWYRFLKEVLDVMPNSDYIPSLRQFITPTHPHVDFENALISKNIDYKKIAYFDFED